MKRNKPTPKKSHIPDAINQSITKEFTQVPNDLLRNPKLSFKSKGILCLLLSNKEGWSSYINTIKQMTKEGEEAIRSGLYELEEAGYLLRVQYRDKKTKIRRGSFWAYTDIPGNFNMGKTIETLEKQGMELFIYQKNRLENLNLENPDMENLKIENQGLKIINIKRHNNKNTNSLSDPAGSDSNIDKNASSSNETKKKLSIQKRSKKYVPLATKLADIVRSNKNIKVNRAKINAWANEIRKMVESDGVDQERIEIILDWYQENIGGEYIPVIESGASLRNKFIRLEEAIKREARDGSKQKKQPTQAIKPSEDKYPC